MAHYQATIDTDHGSEEVFAYLSDFSNTREWDPGVVDAERLTGPEVGLGSRFSLIARFLGRQNQLTYRIVEFDPPRSVTFLGENRSIVSRDRILFEPGESGTRITYDAELKMKGLLKLLDLILGLAFKRVGDRALAGMNQVLAQPLSLR